FKYSNFTPTNTKVFCEKISRLTGSSCGNYQVWDNIGVVGSGHLPGLSDNSTMRTLWCGGRTWIGCPLSYGALPCPPILCGHG
ncbi:hypothetical protein DVH24_019595, partial [Malus domestica]